MGLVDIAATVYDLAGVPAGKRPKTNGVSLRPYLAAAQPEALPDLRASLTARALPIGHLMYDTERWAAVADRLGVDQVLVIDPQRRALATDRLMARLQPATAEWQRRLRRA